MRKSALLGALLALMLLLVPTVSAQDLFNFSADTNGGANRFWVTDKCEYFVSGQAVSGRPSWNNISPWLEEAARVYGGVLKATGNINGTATPNIRRAQENGIAVLSGTGIGGSYRWQFNSQAEAQNFVDFLNAVAWDDSKLFLTNCGLPTPSDFDVSLDTNGGANRFYIENGQFKIWGQSVSGIFATTDVIAWVQEAARLYDGTVVRTGNFNYSTTPNIRRAQDNGRAVLGGRGVGGSFVWQFENRAEAQNFVNFLNMIASAGLFEIDL